MDGLLALEGVDLAELERVGTAHNALDDAKSQAEHLMRMLPEI